MHPRGRGKELRLTILGIDPGSVVTGLGLIVRSGRKVRLVHGDCLRVPVGEPFEKRLLYLHDALDAFLEAHPADEVSIEAPFYGANVKTLMKMCHARGSLLAAVARHGIPVFEYAPREIKKSVVGNGNASKDQVAFMVRQALGDEDFNDEWPLDVTDAIATALCRAHRVGSHPEDDRPAGTMTLADRLMAAGASPETARRVRGAR